MEILYGIVPVLGGLLLFAFMSIAVRAKGSALQRKFIKLGTLVGKSLTEITTACGAPSSVSACGNNIKLCQWMEPGYHIGLLFDENDLCLGVYHEASV